MLARKKNLNCVVDRSRDTVEFWPLDAEGLAIQDCAEALRWKEAEYQYELEFDLQTEKD